jgi:V/A-type H+-transporting ATPase subunit D
MRRLWVEFNPELIAIKDVHIKVKKIAGVKIPILDRIDFEVKPFSLFNNPGWIQDGITILEVLATTAIEREFLHRKMVLLDFARKKTTQKVNLYEKIQIPGFEEAILKIKRFMEDEENLSKSSQKIVKTRQQLEEEAV